MDRPESRYLASLVRAFVEGRGTAPPLPDGADWTHLRAGLLAHGALLPLGLLVPGSSLPETAFRDLEALGRSLRLRVELLLHELVRCVPALEAADAQPLVLKGAALAATVYPRSRPRHFVDLDVLVRRERFQEAWAGMQALGYEPLRGARHPIFYERHHFHRALVSRQRVVVELHWDLTRPLDYARFDLDGLRGRARRVELDGVSLRVPAAADLLLHTASQALRAGFSGIRPVLDAALLLRSGAAEDPGLAARARDQGLASALWVLLDLVRGIAGQAPPPGLEIPLRPVRPVRACIGRLDLSESCLERLARRRTGLKHLLLWVCAPTPAAALAEFRRYLWPDEAHYMDLGYPPDRLPGPWRRMGILARRCLQLARLMGYLAWVFVRRGPRASP